MKVKEALEVCLPFGKYTWYPLSVVMERDKGYAYWLTTIETGGEVHRALKVLEKTICSAYLKTLLRNKGNGEIAYNLLVYEGKATPIMRRLLTEHTNEILDNYQYWLKFYYEPPRRRERSRDKRYNSNEFSYYGDSVFDYGDFC